MMSLEWTMRKGQITHLGPKEKIGNNGGSLSNRLRAILNAYPTSQARSNDVRAILRQGGSED